MTPEEAMAELRNGARNGQFDPELVESFVAMLRREDPAAFIRQAQDADFETELEFERRVRDMAEPRSSRPTPGSQGTHASPWRSGVSSLRSRVLNKQ